METAYDRGFRHFLCGMAQGCDLYFCQCVLDFRRAHPDVTVEAAIPCPTQTRGWPEEQRRRYQRLAEQCDLQTMVSQSYSPYCMLRRDRYMVDHATLVIAVFDGTPGGTQYTVEYALRRGVEVTDVPVLEKDSR